MFKTNAENERLKTENAELNAKNADLTQQVASLQHQLDTIELQIYKKFFERINFSIGGDYGEKTVRGTGKGGTGEESGE